MSNEEKTNKIITMVLLIIITLAAITIIYVNLAEDTDEEENRDQQDGTDDEGSDDNKTEEAVLLTVIFEDEQINYTLEELEALELYTGIGQLIKVNWLPDNVVFEGPFNYTGVKISTFLDQFDDLPENYNLSVKSADQTAEFNFSELQGDIDIYNESGVISELGGVTMLLAYKKEGEYLDETEGPLRIIFVDDGKITLSLYWPKFVISLEITKVE